MAKTDIRENLLKKISYYKSGVQGYTDNLKEAISLYLTDGKRTNTAQHSQTNKIVDIVSYLKDKGIPSEDILGYLESDDILKKSTRGKEITMLDVEKWIDNNYSTTENGVLVKKDVSAGLDSGLDAYQEYINRTLATNANSQFAQQYKQDMYGSINAAENSTRATLAAAELDAYRTLGQQQLQLESQIANQRMQALKSGTTSAQLASQQLANMFSSQIGASQVAQGVLQNKVDTANQYAQQRQAVTSDLYNILANNQATKANAYAQLGAAQASYNSYIQQPYAQYMASMQAYRSDPQGYLAMMGLDQNKK